MPRVSGSPRAAGRSARNYPHLVAEALGLDLVDVTYSGATTAHVLTDSQWSAAPQADVLDGTETLVTVLFVDYLTLLPPPGTAAPPLADTDTALGLRIAATLERLTAEAAAATGCGVVRAAEASRDHHAWSAQPWTTLPTRFGLPLPRRPAPLHPNAEGMRAVADLVTAAANA